MTPEQLARQPIDTALAEAGWLVQAAKKVDLFAGRGVAVREFPLLTGPADYVLYVDAQAVGIVEAKPEGTTLTGVELQAERYSAGLPEYVPAPVRPLPFLYQSTGVETRFTNGLDPDPKSRRVFAFHQPETLAGWIGTACPGDGLLAAETPSPYRLGTLRGRLRQMPSLDPTGLWPAQITAVLNLERSLAEDRPRALIQMATGSGKTFTAISSIYRLIKYGGAQRVLFLVDRANLGRQALKEFQSYTTPDDGRNFTDLYNVQLLTSNRIDPVARVCIGTIQRLYSMLRGEPELDPSLEEGSQFDTGGQLVREPVPVAYNPAIPIETFDVIVIDECHRSIYNLWRQVLEYFDAFLVGLTATPAKQTFGFFNQNLVMEYAHPQAVADGVNVDFTIYRIRTQITEQGATVEAGTWIDRRDRRSRKVRWEQLDDELTYSAAALDRDVVAEDQIRTVIRTFKERLFSEIFPGRSEVPKTLIFAKDDSHADDIVQIVRDEFGRGNDFCQKITYRTATARIVTSEIGPDGAPREVVTYKASGVRAEDLLSAFRNAYNPRIVVSVDMIATGTDVKPLEIVMFLRAVKSRNYFEQMLGRGVRVINPTDFQAVTPDARHKSHFVVIDCVGVTEQELVDMPSLERQPGVAFGKLLNVVAYGNSSPDVVSTLAGRLARLDRTLEEPERRSLAALAGMDLQAIVRGLVAALDPDRQLEEARARYGLAPDAQPSEAQRNAVAAQLRAAAVRPLAANPALREQLVT
ncbi:MAG TPA: DEAD/DEAH box helicase family protein, partial [Thermomicrobiaceae bacterium]|nr:DEAD/DEAH box helicase family protein [Thermomicrobiaceae bacterium]